MQKRVYCSGFRLVIMVLSTVMLVFPVLAQNQPQEEAGPESILRLVIADLKVQGEQSVPAVREAFAGILPALVDCMQTEYQRAGKVPSRTMLRFNLGSNGKVVWSKVVDPPLKSLDACIAKVLPQIQLPPAGTTISRVTILLETKLDHLLAP